MKICGEVMMTGGAEEAFFPGVFTTNLQNYTRGWTCKWSRQVEYSCTGAARLVSGLVAGVKLVCTGQCLQTNWVEYGCFCLLGCIVKFAGAAGMDHDSESDLKRDFHVFLLQELSQYFGFVPVPSKPPTASLFQVMCLLLFTPSNHQCG